MALLHSDMSRQRRRGFARTDPLVQFAFAALVGSVLLIALGTVVFQGTGQALAFALGPYAFAAGVSGYFLHRTYPHAALGMCNIVTLMRLVIVAALLVPFVTATASAWAVVTLAVLALSLDGVDGWLARRAGLCSAFGARFDMEVDSAFALVLAFHALLGGGAGPVVLILGLPRYAFVMAGVVLPWLDRPLPERTGRKVVCVLQIGALILLQFPFVAPPVSGILATVVAAALIWSFGRDIIWLWKERA